MGCPTVGIAVGVLVGVFVAGEFMHTFTPDTSAPLTEILTDCQQPYMLHMLGMDIV